MAKDRTSEKGMNRRKFLRFGGLAGLVAGVNCCLPSCASFLSRGTYESPVVNETSSRQKEKDLHTLVKGFREGRFKVYSAADPNGVNYIFFDEKYDKEENITYPGGAVPIEDINALESAIKAGDVFEPLQVHTQYKGSEEDRVPVWVQKSCLDNNEYDKVYELGAQRGENGWLNLFFDEKKKIKYIGLDPSGDGGARDGGMGGTGSTPEGPSGSGGVGGNAG